MKKIFLIRITKLAFNYKNFGIVHGNALLDFFQLTPRLSLPRDGQQIYLGLTLRVQIFMTELLLRLQIELG